MLQGIQQHPSELAPIADPPQLKDAFAPGDDAAETGVLHRIQPEVEATPALFDPTPASVNAVRVLVRSAQRLTL